MIVARWVNRVADCVLNSQEPADLLSRLKVSQGRNSKSQSTGPDNQKRQYREALERGAHGPFRRRNDDLQISIRGQPYARTISLTGDRCCLNMVVLTEMGSKCQVRNEVQVCCCERVTHSHTCRGTRATIETWQHVSPTTTFRCDFRSGTTASLLHHSFVMSRARDCAYDDSQSLELCSRGSDKVLCARTPIRHVSSWLSARRLKV